MAARTENLRASRLLRGLFSHRVIAFEAREAIGPETLLEQEARCVGRAVPKRVAEFATGRACARRALAELAIDGFPLRAGADREPLWPEGVTGSITHTAGFCGAAVARTAEAASLGIDAEQRGAVQRRLWRQIATPRELQWLGALPRARADDMATLLFSAKEAFFKCQFPLTREWLNFSDVSVSVEPRAGSGAASAGPRAPRSRFRRLHVVPARRLALEGWAPAPWAGRYALAGALIVTGFALPPRQL